MFDRCFTVMASVAMCDNRLGNLESFSEKLASCFVLTNLPQYDNLNCVDHEPVQIKPAVSLIKFIWYQIIHLFSMIFICTKISVEGMSSMLCTHFSKNLFFTSVWLLVI